MRYASPRLLEACDAALAHAGKEDTEALRRCQAEGSLSLADVRLLSRVLRAGSSSAGGSWVHELLSCAAPVLPQRPARAPPHPELEARMHKLRAAQEDRQYAAMVGGLVGGEDADSRNAAEMNTYRSQMGVGLNLIVSMGTMFTVGCYGGGTEEEPYGARVNGPPTTVQNCPPDFTSYMLWQAVICGLALMILTLAVEMSLFLIGATRVDALVHQRERAAHGCGVTDRASPHFKAKVTSSRASRG